MKYILIFCLLYTQAFAQVKVTVGGSGSGGGGGSQTLQQVLTTGSTLTGDNTVAGAGFAYNHLNSKIFLSSPNNNYIDFEDVDGNMTLGANAGDLILSSNDSIKAINPLYTDEIYIATAKRLRLGTNASDLTSPANGDMFYNTGTNKFRGYENGAWVDMIGGGGGGGDMVLASIQTVTGAKTFNTGKLILAGSTSGTVILNSTAIAGTPTLTLPTVTGTITQYVSNTTASSATPAPTGDARENYYDLTALAANATFSAPSGTATNHNKLRIRITDNGTIRTLTWNAIYDEGADVPLPTATVAGETLFLEFDYNSTVSKWQIVGKTGGF